MFCLIIIITGFATAYGNEISSQYTYSCIHYCQTYTYNGYQTYCCRIAQIIFQEEDKYEINTLSETEIPPEPEILGFLPLDDYIDNYETDTISISNEPPEDELYLAPSLPVENVLSSSFYYIPGIYSPAGGEIQEPILPFIYPEDVAVPQSKTERMTCPPVRTYCPGYVPRAFPVTCDNHEGCAETDLCCPDKCLKLVLDIDKVCKTGNPIFNY